MEIAAAKLAHILRFSPPYNRSSLDLAQTKNVDPVRSLGNRGAKFCKDSSNPLELSRVLNGDSEEKGVAWDTMQIITKVGAFCG